MIARLPHRRARITIGAGAGVVFGVILGTGVGGGVVANGYLVAGPNAIAGEWGHIPLPAFRQDHAVEILERGIVDRVDVLTVERSFTVIIKAVISDILLDPCCFVVGKCRCQRPVIRRL